MSDINDRDLNAIKRERAEPEEGINPWPYAVWLFFGVMIGWGTTYMALQSGNGELAGGDQRTITNPTTLTQIEAKVDGSLVFKNVCMACHQQTGLGIEGAFPPLVSSSWVLGDPKTPARIILKGLKGAIVVNEITYNGDMPGFGSQLNDEEVVAVVNYIRNEWGNKASEITKTEVETLRAELKDRTEQWSAEELKELE